MTLTWDAVGSRGYEIGCDRGVLYYPDPLNPGLYKGVAWNGFTGVAEDHGSTTTDPVYLVGVKYLDSQSPGDFAGTLTALTYPDEFAPYEGLGKYSNAIMVDGQPQPNLFHLSYRTLEGNDQAGETAYKIHLLFNVSVIPSNRGYQSKGRTTDPLEFSWPIVAVPGFIPGKRPSPHAIIDSRKLSSGGLASLESILYGTTGNSPFIYDMTTTLNALSIYS